ncbi:hypothetical protein ACFE04_028846 [Oxalis oulophora]
MALPLPPLNFKPICFSSSSVATSITSNHRPAVILPGLGNNSGDYEKLELTLNGYGVPTVVANVSRIDWFRNAAGLLDANYWKGTLQPRPVLDWYLKRVDDAVKEAQELAQGGKLSLIGHSAGGWLARLYMEEFDKSQIPLLLTLEKHCAKAVYTPELRYVCIAGRYVQGARLFDNQNADVSPVVTSEDDQPVVAILNADSNTPTFRARFVGQGYKQVCGKAYVWGDGVVPEESAHLEGALNISLDGVYHSPVGSDDISRPWYGSPAIVEQWIDHLLC